MTTINQLSLTVAISDGDKLPLYQAGQQDTRAVSMSQVAAYVQSAIEGEPDEVIYAISVVGSTFTVAALPTTVGGSVWVQLTLSGPATAGTVILPGVDDRVPGQEVRITCTQSVTSLTINGNGATVAGGPTSLAANGFFTLSYDNISNNWFRVS